MYHENRIELEIRGNYALFSDPLTGLGGEKLSYPVPTYEALKGMLRSVYWKPTIIWVPDKVRVMNVISTDVIGMRRLRYGKSGCTLSAYTCLRNVRYRLSAHFEWNENRPELAADRNEHRHYFGALRMLEKGGSKNVFLGKQCFTAEVYPCAFGEGSGWYDNAGEQDLGFMYHGIVYPDEGWDEQTRRGISVNYWHCVMRDGVICFPRPCDCTHRRFVREQLPKTFGNTEKKIELV